MSDPDPAPLDVDAILAETELPQQRMRYWPELVAAVFFLLVVALAVAAALRTHRTVVVIRDVSKGSVIGPGDVVEARLPRLDAALTTTQEAVDLIAATDIMGGTAVRRKHVLRQQAVTTAAVHRGDSTTLSNVAFRITPYVPDAVVETADLGRVALAPIPAGTIVRKPMLASDRLIGVAARDLTPFTLLRPGEVSFRGKPPEHALVVRAISIGGAIRASDLVRMTAEDASKVVSSYRVIAGPMHPRPGTKVMLMRAGKDEPGHAVSATLLAFRPNGDAAIVVVALDASAAATLARGGTEPVQLIHALGGG
ncbi:MAG TPA: SAF domain-containing protein [Thermoanaerobaculia bacterium]|jgi:hypothetical protein|nr:SAF domain-containing protein [Thermoanaerobaculia bacterium]